MKKQALELYTHIKIADAVRDIDDDIPFPSFSVREKAEGFIIQINKAQIRKLSTGEVMVQWNAPAFSILPAHSGDHRTLKEMTAPCP